MSTRVLIVGGGAAGFFAAIACAEAGPACRVTVVDSHRDVLAKVRLSGGGRCNLSHDCAAVDELVANYPRGRRELVSVFHRFGVRQTLDWFRQRGVAVRTLDDGCVFPVSDSAETVAECLLREARRCGVRILTRSKVVQLRRDGEHFQAQVEGGEAFVADAVLIATGGSRSLAGYTLPASLGHTIVPPVPSLYGLRVREPALHAMAGIVLPEVAVVAPEQGVQAEGALLVTHEGVSGPAVLRLSSLGAREFHAAGYRFPLSICWVGSARREEAGEELRGARQNWGRRQVHAHPLCALPQRLWEWLVDGSGIAPATRWAELTREQLTALERRLLECPIAASGKATTQEEFVTCGGVSLKEVDFRRMASRLCPGLFFAGEVLDLDGFTGGFNLQAAWSTGWLAGQAMADLCRGTPPA